MSAIANHAICEMIHRTEHEIRNFVENREELEKLQESYFRYTDCARRDLQLRELLRRSHGLLGVHFPHVSPETAAKLSPLNTQNSKEVREDLRWWQKLEDFLAVVGETTYSGFCSFMYMLNLDAPSSQAFSSAVKTHPDLFDEGTRNGEKTITLNRRLK
jgi:hypothetical protein